MKLLILLALYAVAVFGRFECVEQEVGCRRQPCRKSGRGGRRRLMYDFDEELDFDFDDEELDVGADFDWMCEEQDVARPPPHHRQHHPRRGLASGVVCEEIDVAQPRPDGRHSRRPPHHGRRALSSDITLMCNESEDMLDLEMELEVGCRRQPCRKGGRGGRRLSSLDTFYMTCVTEEDAIGKPRRPIPGRRQLVVNGETLYCNEDEIGHIDPFGRRN